MRVSPGGTRHNDPGFTGGSLPSAFMERRHVARTVTNGVCHSQVRIPPDAETPADKGPPRNGESFPPPAFPHGRSPAFLGFSATTRAITTLRRGQSSRAPRSECQSPSPVAPTSGWTPLQRVSPPTRPDRRPQRLGRPARTPEHALEGKTMSHHVSWFDGIDLGDRKPRSPDRCGRHILWRGHLLPWREGDRAPPVLAGRADRSGSRFDRGSARGSPRGGGGRAPGPGLFGLCDQPEAGGPRAELFVRRLQPRPRDKPEGLRCCCAVPRRLPHRRRAPGASEGNTSRTRTWWRLPGDPEDPRPASALFPRCGSWRGDRGMSPPPASARISPRPRAGPAAAARHPAEGVALIECRIRKRTAEEVVALFAPAGAELVAATEGAPRTHRQATWRPSCGWSDQVRTMDHRPCRVPARPSNRHEGRRALLTRLITEGCGDGGLLRNVSRRAIAAEEKLRPAHLRHQKVEDREGLQAAGREPPRTKRPLPLRGRRHRRRSRFQRQSEVLKAPDTTTPHPENPGDRLLRIFFPCSATTLYDPEAP